MNESKGNSSRNCAVFGCSMTYAKAKKEEKKVRFYAFPSREWMKERKEIWIRFVKRKGKDGTPWRPSKHSLICSQHFVGGAKSEDPRSPSYNPTIFTIGPENRNAAPGQTGSDSKGRYIRFLRREKLNVHNVVKQKDSSSAIGEHQMECDFGDQEDNLREPEKEEQNEIATKKTMDKAVQMSPPDASMSSTMSGPDAKCVYFGGFRTVYLSGTVRQMTGVSDNVFALLKGLFPNYTSQCRELSLEDKLLITLFKMKTGMSFTCIGTIFGVAATSASRIFFSFLNHLSAVTQDWIFVPSRHAVRETMPASFKNEYPNCRIIIDCTEIKTEVPNSVAHRVHMYSIYKSAFTAKYLVAITPGGFICFCSKGYGGCASDSYITNDCGVLDKLQDGDLIMADKGFPSINISRGTILLMPPFAKRNTKQYPKEDMDKTYTIAKLRIHVERAIQRMKTFEILTRIITNELLPYLDEIVKLVCVIVNLSNPIIKGEHN